MATTAPKFQIAIAGLNIEVTANLAVVGGVQYAFGRNEDSTNIRNKYNVKVKVGAKSKTFEFFDSVNNFGAGIKELDEKNLRNALMYFLSSAFMYNEANYNAGSYEQSLINYAKEIDFDISILKQSSWVSTRKEKEQVKELKANFNALYKVNSDLSSLGVYENIQGDLLAALQDLEYEENKEKFGWE